LVSTSSVLLPTRKIDEKKVTILYMGFVFPPPFVREVRFGRARDD